MADEAEPPKKYRKKAAAEVFAVDRQVWAYVCSLGFDAACAYLVLASGTGHDNRTTWWSATAVERRAGMSWYAAKDAIDLLKAQGVLHEVARKGSWRSYKLSKADYIPGLSVSAGLDDDVYDAPEAPEDRMPVQDGHPAPASKRWYSLKEDEPNCGVKPEPEWNQIWLPNSIVVGAGLATPPIKRLRRAQNPLALRLFVDLYASQYLPRYNGIEWSYPHGIRSTFKAWSVGERGLFKVWGFTPDSEPQSWTGSRLLAPYGAGQGNTEADNAFWGAFELLVRLGLIEMVPHLVANEVGPETPEPDLIHPVPVNNGMEEERAITAAAEQAARTMVPPKRWEFARDERGNVPIVPISIEYERFQLIGIPRLVYRPQTEVTEHWLARGTKAWAQWVRAFEALEEAATAPASDQALRKKSRK